MGTDDWRVVLDRAEAAVSALAEMPAPSGAAEVHGRRAAEAMQELRRVLSGPARAAGADAFDLNRMEVLGQLAGGIAHEINNWFFVIRGFSELARFDLTADSPLTENLDQIEDAVDRAEGLTRMILECSHPSGDGSISTLIHPLVKEGLKITRTSLPDGVVVQQAISTEAAPVLVEPIAAFRVILNLMKWAVDRLDASPGLLWVALATTEAAETGAEDLVVLTVGSAAGDESDELHSSLQSGGAVEEGPPPGHDNIFVGIDKVITGFGGKLRHRSTDGGRLCVEVVLPAETGPAIR